MTDPEISELFHLLEGAYARGVLAAYDLHIELVNARTASEWEGILRARASDIRAWATSPPGVVVIRTTK